MGQCSSKLPPSNNNNNSNRSTITNPTTPILQQPRPNSNNLDNNNTDNFFLSSPHHHHHHFLSPRGSDASSQSIEDVIEGWIHCQDGCSHESIGLYDVIDMSLENDNLPMMWNLGCGPKAVRCFKNTTSAQVKENAIVLLYNLSCHEANRIAMYKLPCIKMLKLWKLP
jgi:hypothetical protein